MAFIQLAYAWSDVSLVKKNLLVNPDDKVSTERQVVESENCFKETMETIRNT